MNVRPATEGDLATVRAMWEELVAELDEPKYSRETWDEAHEQVETRLHDGAVLLAEQGGVAVGLAELDLTSRLAWVESLYVRPQARRQGVARALLREIAAMARGRGVGHVGLEVLTESREARAVYDRLGFKEFSRSLAIGLDELEQQLAREEAAPSQGSVYVQTDDEGRVERAVATFVPRLGRSERTEVSPPHNGWIAVHDELCSRDPKLLRRLARELSDRLGAVVLSLGIEEGAVVRYVLFERGRIADEYASVPEYYGPLPPGDVVALCANPTVAARLTGADPARVREVARTATSSKDLPSPGELVAEIAAALGVGSSP